MTNIAQGTLVYIDFEPSKGSKIKRGQPISEPHSNTKYEDTEDNKTVYVRTPWGSLIELQTIPNGYYYPKESEAEVFTPKK